MATMVHIAAAIASYEAATAAAEAPYLENEVALVQTLLVGGRAGRHGRHKYPRLVAARYSNADAIVIFLERDKARLWPETHRHIH